MTEASFHLHHLIRKPKDQTKPAPVLFLFHGFGSHERDLHTLSVHVPEDWLVITARGPILVGPNQFKWFEVDRAGDWFEVEQADRKMIVDIESERAARHHVQGFIDQMVREHNADASQIVVAGFSQGAALSLNLFLTQPEKFIAVGAFGGRVMDEIKPQIAGKDALDAKHVFLGFGTQDPFISHEQALKTEVFLQNLGLNVRSSHDDVGHSISGKHWKAFGQFLEMLHKHSAGSERR